jgi:gluconokinase
MGVSGCGKSTVGRALAQKLSCSFFDADDFHSPENKAKMSAGIALDDSDRAPWLESLGRNIQDWLAAKQCPRLARSALKASYRRILGGGDKRVLFIYLKLSFAEIEKRLAARKDHFMSKDLLESQFSTLEEPECAWNESFRKGSEIAYRDEALTVTGREAPESIACEIITLLNRSN